MADVPAGYDFSNQQAILVCCSTQVIGAGRWAAVATAAAAIGMLPLRQQDRGKKLVAVQQASCEALTLLASTLHPPPRGIWVTSAPQGHFTPYNPLL
jgi:hypothetical protein